MEKRISKKILVIGVIFLCLGASAIAGAKQATKTTVQTPKPLARDWSDGFEAYSLWQLLDGLPSPDDGGWKGWDNVPSAAGQVTNVQAHSGQYSNQIWLNSDNVHEYPGYTSGQWVYTAWQYIPENFSGMTYFILLSDYWDGGDQTCKWALQIHFDSVTGFVESERDYTVDLPLIKGRWVQLRCDIDLTADSMSFYYDNELLISKPWTAGPNNLNDGILNISAVDLFANGASPVYYDDISLAPPGSPLSCEAGGPYSGEIGEAIHFIGSASGGATPYTYAWTFGDGGTSTDQNPDHSYTAAGNYTATLTVTDAGSQTATDTAAVTIVAPVPHFKIDSIKGGLGITAVINNTGTIDATASWKIQLDGGLILVGKSKTGSVDIAVGKTATIKDFVFGIGKTTIAVTAGDASKTATGTVLIILVLKVV
jgi:hypothetical protein